VIRSACALLFAAATGWAQAQAQAPVAAPAANDGLQWLQRIYRATETLSYSGTFVYQQGNRTETSRITRRAGTGGTIEKLEVMDGTPREILRTPDEVRCYLPESRTIKVDRRGDTGSFPALLPEQVGALQDNYEISLGAKARIAGYDCQAILLNPKDDLRYGYALWADVRTAMLLRAQTFNGNGDLVEQFSFVLLDVGDVPRSRLRPPRAARDWRVEQTAVSPVDFEHSGWRVENELPGFRKVAALRRVIGKAHPVDQIVYSDGMAALSIFIEPMSPRTEKARFGLSGMGAVNVYTRQVDHFLVTVVGEAPAKSVQRIGDTVQYRPQ
jgi:sigma-E factor negative regulatory protein RseB